MKFTIALPQSNRVSSPTAIRDVAQAAEELGFWALSMHDHLTFDGQWIGCGSATDLGTSDVRSVYEPLTTYAHVAALTERVRLLLSIMLLPAREPLMTAKQLATLDRLSGGRVSLGIGVGLAGNETEPPFVRLLAANAAQEWAALGVPVRRRGRLSDERLGAMQALWTDESASYTGDFISFTDVAMYPKPQQPGGIPILVAGSSPAALARTARGGHSWLPNHARADEIAAGISYLHQLHEQHQTTFSGEVVLNLFMRLDENVGVAESALPQVFRDSLGPEVSDRNLLGNPDDLIARTETYRAAGVTALDLKPVYDSVDELLVMMKRFADEVMAATSTPAAPA